MIGHSMGAFVSVAFAGKHADRLRGVLLVDGGYPLEVPAGMDAGTLIRTVLAPVATRLAQSFASKEAYRDFWRAHPSFVGHWSPSLEAYSDYDLVPAAEPGSWRAATRLEAMTQDSRALYESEEIEGVLQRLPPHTTLLTAPRGLVNTAPLYPPSAVARIKEALPSLIVREIPDVNHYTIIMAEAGAGAVAAETILAGERAAW